MAPETAATKVKKSPKAHVLPSLDNNRAVIEKCSVTKVDLRKVMAHFNCSRTDALILAAAAEMNLVPGVKK
jgi:hypothetical protein